MAVKADPQNWCTIFPYVRPPFVSSPPRARAGGGSSSLEATMLTRTRNKVCNPGSGSDADRLWVIGSYYDLSNPEYGWGERAQSFSCKSCPNCRN